MTTMILHSDELRHESDPGHERRALVTTRAGITIGGAWTPPPPVTSRDAETIQAVLLEPDPGSVSLVGLLWRRFVRWL